MFKLGIIISSDKGFKGEREDHCIPTILDCVENHAFETIFQTIVPDEIVVLQTAIKHCVDDLTCDLVLISGGTGFSVRDVTPEALAPLLDKHTPGISEAIRSYSMTLTKKAMLSRAISGIRKNCLIITLPGSPRAVKESLDFIMDPLIHGLEIMIGSASECARRD